jgi:hypothetical protein
MKNIADRLNEDDIIEFDCDSRSVWLCIREETENQTPENPLQPVATTGNPKNEDYGIEDVDQVSVCGEWVTIVIGTDGSIAHWDGEKWVPGEPS